jgi:type I restriction enzyme S subunit
LLELLEEKRLAVITHAVTKGVDPNAPMKDSGIDWLGQIPAHWGVRHLKRSARPVSSTSGRGWPIRTGCWHRRAQDSRVPSLEAF